MKPFSVIVSDASPLISLAAANALHTLTLPGLRVIVPDMVYDEVTRDITKLGAAEFVKWYRANPGAIELAVTDVFIDFQAVQIVRPTARLRNRGEEAAIEILRDRAEADQDFAGLLLFDDSDLIGRQIVRGTPGRVKLLTTRNFLIALETAGRLQSADEIVKRAVDRGRFLRQRGYDDPDLTAELARQWSDQNGD